jgi:membrane protein implicated in regulation of membrane protease activity
MSQSRISSLIEAVINVAIGFVVSLGLTAVVLPAYGHAVTLGQNLQITCIFTVSSILRSYCVRRWFNARIHQAAQRLAGN